MAVPEPAIPLRIVGVAVNTLAAVFAVKLAIEFAAGKDQSGSIIIFSPVIWCIMSAGEWMWSFEGGWEYYRHFLRVIILSSTICGIIVPIITIYIIRHFT